MLPDGYEQLKNWLHHLFEFCRLAACNRPLNKNNGVDSKLKTSFSDSDQRRGMRETWSANNVWNRRNFEFQR
jgi:hypothetical protein